MCRIVTLKKVKGSSRLRDAATFMFLCSSQVTFCPDFRLTLERKQNRLRQISSLDTEARVYETGNTHCKILYPRLYSPSIGVSMDKF